jgi:hypothetical protein
MIYDNLHFELRTDDDHRIDHGRRESVPSRIGGCVIFEDSLDRLSGPVNFDDVPEPHGLNLSLNDVTHRCRSPSSRR